jgi:hypothetical protein
MPILDCRIVARAQRPFIHVVWYGQRPAGLRLGLWPPNQQWAPVDPDDWRIERPPGGQRWSLRGWVLENGAPRQVSAPRGVGWAYTWRPTAQADTSWVAPSALVRVVSDFPPEPYPNGDRPAVELICDPSPDGSANIVQAIDREGQAILRRLSGPGVQGAADDLDGLRRGIEDLIGFNLQTGSGGAPGGSGSSSVSGPGGQALVDAQIQRILGRRPSVDDVTGTLALLDRVMVKTVTDGVERWEVRPGGAYVVQADNGAGVTGRQASVAGLARDTLEQIKPLVEQVRQLAPRTRNPQLLEAARYNFLTSATEAVAEAGALGGPIRFKAEVLLNQSLDELARFGQELGVLRRNQNARLWQPTRHNVVAPGDEEQFTKFVIILDRWRVYDDAFRDYLGFRRRANTVFDVTQRPERDFGLRFTLLDRSVDVLAEAIDELDAALLSVGVDRQERLNLRVTANDLRSPTIAEFMDWAQAFPEREARQLIQQGGVAGAHLLPARLDALERVVRRLRNQAAGPPGGAQDGYRALHHPRVRVAVEKLLRELEAARDSAQRAENVSRP